MPINDEKSIKLIEKKTNMETLQMNPIYEINSQFAHYVLLNLDSMCYKC